MKRICTICARGGSKGLPGKNLRKLLGKSLIAHSIEHARATGLFDAIAMSSDDDDILLAAKQAGVDHLVKRPSHLASDVAAKIPAIQHCVRAIEEKLSQRFDIIVDVDATAPLRLPEDIAGAVALQEAGGCDNVITGCEAHRSPYFNLVEMGRAGFVSLSKPVGGLVRRQDSPKCYDCNASIYVWSRETFFVAASAILQRTKIYEMPRERSLDIDNELDFEIVEFLMRRARHVDRGLQK